MSDLKKIKDEFLSKLKNKLNLLEIIECGQKSKIDFKSAYFNRRKGEIENVRNCFLIKWNEQKITQLTYYTNPIKIPQKRGHTLMKNSSIDNR